MTEDDDVVTIDTQIVSLENEREIRKPQSPKHINPRTQARGGHNAKPLRRRAMILYVSDPSCETLEDLAEHPDMVGRIGYDRLKVWCREDGWVEERRRFWQQASDVMRGRIIDTMADGLAIEVQNLLDIRTKVHKMLMSDTLAPKSYEGMLKAYLDLNKRIAEATSIAAEKMFPKQDRAQLDELPEDLDPEIADRMAQAAIEARRDALNTGSSSDVASETSNDDADDG